MILRIKKFLNDCKLLLKYHTTDMFSHIYIDTITACNRRCSYCPNSKYDRGLIKNTRKMKTKLFHKIIYELAEIKFEGEIAPNFYGEPLLDERLPHLVDYTRKRLPYAKIIIFTNGDFLTLVMYKKLIKFGVNTFIITQHSKEESKKIKDIIKYQKKYNNPYNVKLVYSRLAYISNRGGLIKLKKTDHKFNGCYNIPSFKIGVDYRGNVLFCCEDYFSKIKLGNIKNEKLMDIWQKPYYKRLRKEIKKGIFKLELCKKCRNGSL